MNAIIDNKALDKKNLPTKLKILSWGRNDTTNGTVWLNERTVEVFNTKQKEIGRDKDVPIDFDHCSVPGTEDFVAGKPKSIAGYGNPLLVVNDGLYLTDIKWTPLGEECARNYKDLSPAAMVDKDGTVQQLHSCALTPAGAVANLMFYSAKQCEEMKLMAVKDYNKDDANAGAIPNGNNYIANPKPMAAGSPATEDKLADKSNAEHAKNSQLMSADKSKGIDDKGIEHGDDCTCASCMCPDHYGADDKWSESEHKAHKQLVKDFGADDDHYSKYGNVKYADEGQNKYPIDTDKHIRAAYSYVSMPKNAKKLGGKLSEVKAKIQSAMKKIGAKTEDATKTMSANNAQPYNMENTNIKTMAALEAQSTKQDKGEKSDAARVLFAYLAQFLGEYPEFLEQLTKKQNTEQGGLEQWTASTKVDDLEKEIKLFKAELNDKQIDNERQNLIAQATKEGKVITLSANAIKKLDVTDLTEYIAKLSPVVPMKSNMRLLSADAATGKPSRSKAIEIFNTQLARK